MVYWFTYRPIPWEAKKARVGAGRIVYLAVGIRTEQGTPVGLQFRLYVGFGDIRTPFPEKISVGAGDDGADLGR